MLQNNHVFKIWAKLNTKIAIFTTSPWVSDCSRARTDNWHHFYWSKMLQEPDFEIRYVMGEYWKIRQILQLALGKPQKEVLPLMARPGL